MFIEYLLSLPACIIVKATDRNPAMQFDLHIFKNHSRELRLCYEASEGIVIPWDAESGRRSFIFLIENIADDTDLIEAAQYVLHSMIQYAEYIEPPFKFNTTKD